MNPDRLYNMMRCLEIRDLLAFQPKNAEKLFLDISKAGHMIF